ncbi:hypothetical protein OSB04_031612 [Centaurea solstitialis]|uniref:Uncharacterized protein n=1 Tax=Centaurea solstitialis TaxID=347529 RepID=A0AA38W661_9ASTR|nr:hypothetical protein OSB04_031612 [Centaurea solstitialis]
MTTLGLGKFIIARGKRGQGCLCKSYAYDSQFIIWVMKQHKIKESWHKELVITQAIFAGLDWGMIFYVFLGLQDGTILAVISNKMVAYCPKSKTIEDLATFNTQSIKSYGFGPKLTPPPTSASCHRTTTSFYRTGHLLRRTPTIFSGEVGHLLWRWCAMVVTVMMVVPVMVGDGGYGGR